MSIENNISKLQPFLMSSVPKSGTHLLQQILNGIPYTSNDINDAEKKFFVDHHPQDIEIYKDHFYRLAHLQAGEFGVGHMFYSEKYAYMLKRLNLKHVFIYRDPRDVLISLIHFIPKHWIEHPLYNDFNKSITNNKERIMTLIHGTEAKWPNFDKWNRPFYNWIGKPNTLAISFESLMNSIESRRNCMMTIVQYLWEEDSGTLPIEKIIDAMEANINPGKSRTFREGKIASWKEEFDNEIKEAFKKVAGDLLIDFGYEKDNNW
ncbi:sulfotransferase domain-containing protein [Priestia megaterium]|uniref:sulfotransferase domain-containing protein n=1 Tax=Priestia megaterium TaxID=1404 RepID=UPI00298D1626|nr:sulfotransferase domain-containing protein [Priestia megaterium]